MDDFMQQLQTTDLFNKKTNTKSTTIDNNDDSIKVLNKAIFSWCKNNKPFYGYNWKCGQEASFRVINVLTGLIKRTCPNLILENIQGISDIKN